MKKWCVLLAAVLVAVCVTGCGGVPDSRDGLPPLEKDLKQLYAGAQEGYDYFFCQSVPTDGIAVSLGGRYGYEKCTDERFLYYDQFRVWLQQYFTADYIDQYLLGSTASPYAEKNGLLYVLPLTCRNDYYAGHVFSLVSRDDTAIKLRADIYYTESPDPENYFYEPPMDMGKYTTRTAYFTMMQTGEGWRFDSFSSLYN